MEGVDEFKSLVKYGKPLLFVPNAKEGGGDKKVLFGEEGEETKTEDILNSILPPREYTKDKKQLYIETVLTTPATKGDVVLLEKELDDQLQKRRAKEIGLCAIREDLYSQCFDELIRQITINCSHRGLLLVRVRDELRMNLQCYQGLYESAMAYGLRRAMASETEKTRLLERAATLENEIEDLTKETQDLELEMKDMEEADQTLRAKEESYHQEETTNLMKKNQRLKEELEKKLTTIEA